MVLSQQFAWVCISQSPRVFGFWVGFVWLVCVWVFCFVVGVFFGWVVGVFFEEETA